MNSKLQEVFGQVEKKCHSTWRYISKAKIVNIISVITTIWSRRSHPQRDGSCPKGGNQTEGIESASMLV